MRYVNPENLIKIRQMEYIKREYMSSFDVSINLPCLIPINDCGGIALIVN